MDNFIIYYFVASHQFTKVFRSTIGYLHLVREKQALSYELTLKISQQFLIIWAQWWKSVVKCCYEGDGIHLHF